MSKECFDERFLKTLQRPENVRKKGISGIKCAVWDYNVLNEEFQYGVRFR